MSGKAWKDKNLYVSHPAGSLLAENVCDGFVQPSPNEK